MFVLIVTKTTNYELHGAVIEAKVAQGRVGEDALLRLKTAHAEHYQTLNRLREALTKAKIDYSETSRTSAEPWPKSPAAVLTVGGDGTLLAATHQMTDGGLVLGIRSSVSSVGYLCCAGSDRLESLVTALAEGRIKTQDVHRLKARIQKIDTGQVLETEPVLNDFLYSNVNPAATTRYRLTFGEESEIHRSSGIWIATGAGSTAAVFAAGGERRPLSDPLAQYRVRELYCLGHDAATLQGGLFDPDLKRLEIENRCPEALLALDGQHGTIPLQYGDTVRILRAPPVALAVKLEA